MHCASLSAVAVWPQSRACAACSADQFVGSNCLPSATASDSTPDAHQSECASSASACCNVARTPLRLRRDSWLSSGDMCGTSRPAGRLEAPLAAWLAWSSTVTCQPRRARLAATALPARPAPTTTQVLGAIAPSCVRPRALRVCHAGLKRAFSVVFWVAVPTTKPHCASLAGNQIPGCGHIRSAPRLQSRDRILRV